MLLEEVGGPCLNISAGWKHSLICNFQMASGGVSHLGVEMYRRLQQLEAAAAAAT